MKKVNMYVHKISLSMANPRKFNNLILPLWIQRRRRNCYVDQISSVFGFQRLVRLWVYQVLESVLKKLWSFLFFWNWKQLSTQHHTEHLKTEHLNTIFPARFVENCSTQLKHQTKVWLKWWVSVCSVVCLHAIKYPPLKPAP